MALTARHRWCMSKLEEAFAGPVDSQAAQVFMRKDENLSSFNGLFQGTGTKCLFVMYQTKEEDEGAAGKPYLFISDGTAELLTHKCCYFLRATRDGVAVDTAVGGDASLLFGEMSGSALEGIEAALASFMRPMLEASDGWGKTDVEQKGEFMSEVGHFMHALQEGLKSMVGGLDLTAMNEEMQECSQLQDTRAFTQKINQQPALLGSFEHLLESWCDQIEGYLNPKGDSRSSDIGPKAELEYWRNRMQRLTSITEQLKRKDVKGAIGLLNTLSKNSADPSKHKMATLLRRWKQIDVSITEAANEAKDNVKYLFTLERFIEPLYSDTASSIIDTLPALMNSIKMIHTIARYYNTDERMTGLFAKITDQMIANCKDCIMGGGTMDELWDKNPQELVRQLEGCLKLNEAYQEQYRLTKSKLQQTPKGKQFNFSEMEIFGKFDLFCRRAIKLIDMFSTIDQFNSLSENKLEGMEALIDQFHGIVRDFRYKRHDLLAYHNNKFDRDYMEFNVKISDLEGSLQQFINQSFENITSIEHSLKLLRKFQSILQRESLKSDLDSKLNIIFQNYGMELDQVQQLYERQKHDPPIPRNLPPVAGNITWSRHLLKRIEEPMKQFESNQNVLAGKDAKRIIKMYNKVARTLVAFEYLWYQAWVQSIEQAKAGLQATLIIRHPDDGKLYVNFDGEILQLIREAKCLDRMGVDIPESAKIALFQEEKFKANYNDLHWALTEYDRVVTEVIPVTAMVLRPHFNDMEFKLRPGMITLTWTSMNIASYKGQVHAGLRKLEELVSNINDIIENRIEKNLKIVSKTLLVDLPDDQSFTVQEFVDKQHKHIMSRSRLLQGKNVEILHAVEDLVKIIHAYPLDAHLEKVSEEEVNKLRAHYNHFMYQALLHCAKNSMNALKNRIQSKTGFGLLFIQRPFFEVDVQLEPPSRVNLSPSLDEIQECINRSAQAILGCFKEVHDWDQVTVPAMLCLYLTSCLNSHQGAGTFFERVTKDIEIVRVALLLTGCIQGIRNTVQDYLMSFGNYDWLWKSDKDAAYEEFMKNDPTLDDYSCQLKTFSSTEGEIDEIRSIHNIGALSLNTSNLKGQLKGECSLWKSKYCQNLHEQAKSSLENLNEYMRVTMGKLKKEVSDLDTLRFMMNLLKEVRARESGIDMEINPISNMYQMLEHHLGNDFMEKEEIDKKTVLRSNWTKLIRHAESRADELSKTQISFKRGLIRNIRDFAKDVTNLRNDFVKNGPMVQGIPPVDAVERLNRFKEEFKIRERKYDLYQGGEELFALPKTDYPDLEKTKKELKLSDQLFGLYVDVRETLSEWKQVLWTDVVNNIGEMTEKMDNFAARCKKLPGRLREWDAYKQLRQEIDDFLVVLPLLQELSKESIMPRHWDEVQEVTGTEFEIGPDFKLQTLLEINLAEKKEEIEEITDGADKQLKIQIGLQEIIDKWSAEAFVFTEWKGRGINCLKGTGGIMEELEEAQMNLQTMLSMRHVTPFREEAQEELTLLSETSDTLERWLKVQLMWCALESVFTGGDIAKQMPMEAKKFAKIDKDWAKIMAKASETELVTEASANENLRKSLPVMYAELEKCQKSLEGYLEQKRNKFPRFYFVSNPGLLVILSQGSDPLSMNDHYEKVFDAVSNVTHNKTDKTIIEKMNGQGAGAESIPFSVAVKAQGNIEDWLCDLLYKMQLTMKDLTRICAGEVANTTGDISALRPFVDGSIAQMALLGIQLMWTTDVQSSLEQCRQKKNIVKECNQRQLQILQEMSSWCLLDLGSKSNRTKVETLVTIHVHQRDVINDLATLHRQKRISDANDFEWLKQARFYWRSSGADEVNDGGACIISITDVDFNYQYEYMGSKERLVVTPLTDR
ncbi:unnamed protein product [Chrysoparadoxa australica]